ncbi:hypothetical protein MD484_g8397, partial [Candolleomyces efflorescens]
MTQPPDIQEPVFTPPELDESPSNPFNELRVPHPPDDEELQGPASAANATQESSNASSDKRNLESSTRIFLESQSTSTPHGPKASMKYAPDSKRDQHKQEVEADLGEPVEVDSSGEWVRSLYVDLAKGDDIKNFLANKDVYTGQRWVGIPIDNSAPSRKLHEVELYKPYVKVINRILQWFVHQVRDGTEASESSSRVAIDTHVTNLSHQEEETDSLWSRPDVSVKASGNSFQVPRDRASKKAHGVGFENMSSFQEMKLERQKWSDRDQWQQVGVYARQIFIQQPNRRFVRALVLTENKVRLFHFDRSGGMYTPFIDIHAEPEIFIRLVAGLNSHDENVVGLDTSFKWIYENGRKVKGTLTATTADGASQVDYRLCKVDPITPYYCIRGRATQCWSVEDPDSGMRYLIKDCWKDEKRVSEDVYLEEAKHLPGVGKMVSFLPNRGETKFLRGSCGITHEDFYNRVAVRIMMIHYGDSIENFKSAKQLLRALRDAIIGKFLFPNPLARLTWSPCVLIDLHLAIKVGRDIAQRSADWRSGSSLFQSISVLLGSVPLEGSLETIPPLAQDYLDDLESFFYIYIYLIHVYDSNGVLLPFQSHLIKEWRRETPKGVATSKRAFLVDIFTPRQIAQEWPEACIKLLNSFGSWIEPYTGKKRRIVLRYRDDLESVANEEFEEMMKEVAAQYRQVIRMFNDAILSLEINDSDGGSDLQVNAIETKMYIKRFTTPPLENVPASPDGSPLANKVLERNARKALKRYPEEDPQEVPEAKRVPQTPCTPERKVSSPSKDLSLARPMKRKNHFVYGGSPLAKL